MSCSAIGDTVRARGFGTMVLDAKDALTKVRYGSPSRRFLVSDDPDVGYFLVRDCDSVVSAREAAAVAKWLGSGLPFHAMRDYYTHTDPLLAGMWGGIAGVFPDIKSATT